MDKWTSGQIEMCISQIYTENILIKDGILNYMQKLIQYV